jgi:hypothetical protein
VIRHHHDRTRRQIYSIHDMPSTQHKERDRANAKSLSMAGTTRDRGSTSPGASKAGADQPGARFAGILGRVPATPHLQIDGDRPEQPKPLLPLAQEHPRTPRRSTARSSPRLPPDAPVSLISEHTLNTEVGKSFANLHYAVARNAHPPINPIWWQSIYAVSKQRASPSRKISALPPHPSASTPAP